MNLSIIIPAFNEEKTIGVVLDKLQKIDLPNIKKEIIVVDDGSKDRTVNIVKGKQEKYKEIKLIEKKKNGGKGSAVQEGLISAKGKILMIQDADLEYDPNDIPKLIKPILERKAQVVYGTRLRRLPNIKKEERTFRFFLHYVGNRGLSFITTLLYGSVVTDMETCYKIFTKEAFEGMKLKSRTFDFEPEITAKFLKRGIKITEIDITTKPRGYNEGKKLNTFRDGIKALWTLVKYRFVE